MAEVVLGRLAMENAKHKEDESLEGFGLKVAHGRVEVGNTYPIFGMITKLLEGEDGEVLVELNNNIHAKMSITDPERLAVLRKKAFETGIFISRVVATEPVLEVECRAVIFGKSQAYNA